MYLVIFSCYFLISFLVNHRLIFTEPRKGFCSAKAHPKDYILMVSARTNRGHAPGKSVFSGFGPIKTGWNHFTIERAESLLPVFYPRSIIKVNSPQYFLDEKSLLVPLMMEWNFQCHRFRQKDRGDPNRLVQKGQMFAIRKNAITAPGVWFIRILNDAHSFLMITPSLVYRKVRVTNSAFTLRKQCGAHPSYTRVYFVKHI